MNVAIESCTQNAKTEREAQAEYDLDALNREFENQAKKLRKWKPDLRKQHFNKQRISYIPRSLG